MDSLDHTVIKPRPGRKNSHAGAKQPLADQTVITPRKKTPGGGVPPIQSAAASSSPTANDNTIVTPRSGRKSKGPVALTSVRSYPRLGCSALVSAASDVVAIVPQLRQITGNINVNQLHNFTKLQIQSFENKALSVCDDSQIRIDSSYVLCALIDEAVLNTPWGESSSWSQSPMLSIFHHETYGGERVYDILTQAQQSPGRYQDILELIYLALSLGFMGKLRVDPQGSIKIEQHRSHIYELLNRSREQLQLKLSPGYQPLTGFNNRLHSFLPYWIICAVLVLAAFGLYSYWSLQLNSQSDITRKALADIVPSSDSARVTSGNTPGAVLALRDLLADEILREVVQIEDYSTHTDITLPNNGMFSSGSAEINAALQPVLDKIAKALEAIPGRIMVTGHTDDRAIRTAKYPSNWHLSLARASAVVKYMDGVARLDSRLLPEGKGSEQPIANNDDALGRAANRRVVIAIHFPRKSALQKETGR
jgi:type VI secretion system protein ImpK